METEVPTFMGFSKSSSWRVVYRDTGQPQEIRNIPNKPSNFISKGSREWNTNKPPKLVEEGHNKDQSGSKWNQN